MTVKVYGREALLIRSKKLPSSIRKELLERYTFRFYNDKACGGCEYLPDRHSDICDNCASFLGATQLAKNVKIGQKQFFSVPHGGLESMGRVLKRRGIDYKVVSRHPDQPFKRPIKFTGELRDYQPDAVNAILEKKKGVLQAPPRSGKTVMGTAAICKIGKKTLILASQRDWLVGFYETFCGSKTQKPLTNARGSGVTPAESREYFKTKKRASIGFCRTLDQFKRHDVCLATVQTFYSEAGVRLLRKLRDEFSVVMVDEIHTGAAPKYASVLARLNTEYKVGLTGTPDRKDCVAPGTLVTMADGSIKAIENILVGDVIACVDELSGKLMSAPVAELHQRPASKLVRVHTENGPIDCTEDHLFWSHTRRAWIKAIDLLPEDEVIIYEPSLDLSGSPLVELDRE